MAPVQSKLVLSKNLHQTSLIPVRAATPHGHTNFMSLGRIVVDKTTHHDNSQHIHLQGSNFSGATGVNIGSGTATTSISNTSAAGSVKDSAWYERKSKRRYRDDYKGTKIYDKNYSSVKAGEDKLELPPMCEIDSESEDEDEDEDDDDIIEIIDNKKRPATAPQSGIIIIITITIINTIIIINIIIIIISTTIITTNIIITHYRES